MAGKSIHEPGRASLVADRNSSGHAGLTLLAIVALFLAAAIGFFMMTDEKPGDRKADAALNAAQSVGDAAENATRRVEEAARRKIT